MSNKKSKERIDESEIDWSGFGELVWKSYQERLKEGIPPEFQIRRTTAEFKEYIHKRIMERR